MTRNEAVNGHDRSKIPRETTVPEVQAVAGKSRSNTARLSTTMPKERLAELKRMVTDAELSTVSDLIDRALSFYKWLLQQKRENRSLYVRDPDGTFHAVITMT